jgi:hypothetical protein
VPITVRQIRDDILNPDIRLVDVLRKAKVLGYRLDLPELKQWVDHELDGYEGSDVELPDYRCIVTGSYGTFSGFGGARLENYPIPTLGLPDVLRDRVETLEIRQGVAALEGLQFAEEPSILLAWSPNWVAVASEVGKIYEGYALVSAHRVLGKNHVDAALDTVRNRVLAFVLELETRFPEKAESEEAAGEIPTDLSAQIFHTHVYGGQNVIASGHDITQQMDFSPPDLLAGDLEALLGYVRKLGVPEEDVIQLQEIVEVDEVPSEPKKLGPRAESWLGRLATKGIEGAATATAGQVVQYTAKAVAQFYGLDSGP